MFVAIKRCGSIWLPWPGLQRLWKLVKPFSIKEMVICWVENMLSARAFEWNDTVAVRVCPRVEWMDEKCRQKKVWEKFVAFVVKCREARKHQESRRQWTRLQPGYDRSLQSSIPFRGNSVHFRVRGDWWKNVAKKVWKKFVAFVVKCREARKHLASWWLWTGLQTDYDRSL